MGDEERGKVGEFFERAMPECIREVSSDDADGVFPAVLATQGEAADGHILEIAGNKTPARMPMLFGHRSVLLNPLMGSIVKPHKETRGSEQLLLVEGRVNMDGDSILGEIRRDIYGLVKARDLRGMSLRWRPIETIRRTELPSSHWAYVDSAKVGQSDARHWGHLHKRSASEEGSIVALGADPKALSLRSNDLSSHSRVFMRALAQACERDEYGMGGIAEAFAAVEESLEGVRNLGAEDADLANLLAGTLKGQKLRSVTFNDADGNERTLHIPVAALLALKGESLEELRTAMALCREAADNQRSQEHTEPEPDPKGQQRSQEHMSNTVGGMTVEDFTRVQAAATRSAVDAVLAQRIGRIPRR